jgi:hypothetical protein
MKVFYFNFIFKLFFLLGWRGEFCNISIPNSNFQPQGPCNLNNGVLFADLLHQPNCGCKINQDFNGYRCDLYTADWLRALKSVLASIILPIFFIILLFWSYFLFFLLLKKDKKVIFINFF